MIQFDHSDLRETLLKDRLPDELREAIGETVGFASLCWEPKPHGQFDASQAAVAAFNLCQLVADHLSTAVELREALEATQDALQWASGSADFGTGGKARRGWLRLARPALDKAGIVLEKESQAKRRNDRN